MDKNFLTVVEVQFFRDKNNKYWIKELCILKDGFKALFVSLPPHDWDELPKKLKKVNQYSEERLHQLLWEEGTTEFNDMEGLLKHKTRDSKYIFTKGEEKSRILSEILGRDVVDLTFETPSYQKMEARVKKCLYRNHNVNFCAYANAHKLFDFIIKKKNLF